MRNNKLIIAGAGSGKTTYLIKEALDKKDGNVLITTYTQANEEEIRRKIIEVNSCIPHNITVQTWFSMLLKHGVKPFQGCLYEGKINGLFLVNQQSAVRFKNKYGIPIYYKEEDIINHYFNSERKIYSDKLSKFVCRCNQLSEGAVIERLSKIYTHIFIDEVQDLSGYDLEFIKLLLASNSNILLVGDPRQVIYLTHNEKKYEKYIDGKIKDFLLTECKKNKCVIDEEILNVSHRNNNQICRFASKLYPEFNTCESDQHEDTKHDGVFLVREKDVEKYLNTYKPVQLRDSIKVKTNKNYKSMNFGESKGLTFNRVLIYPTQPFIAWLKDNNTELKPISRSKFYVALTRAKYSSAIVYNFDDKTDIDGTKKFVI